MLYKWGWQKKGDIFLIELVSMKSCFKFYLIVFKHSFFSSAYCELCIEYLDSQDAFVKVNYLLNIYILPLIEIHIQLTLLLQKHLMEHKESNIISEAINNYNTVF